MKYSERVLISSLGALIIVFFSFQVGSIYKLDLEHEAQVEEILATNQINLNSTIKISPDVYSGEIGTISQNLVDSDVQYVSYKEEVSEVKTLNQITQSPEIGDVRVLEKGINSIMKSGIITELNKSGFAWLNGGVMEGFKTLNARKGITGEGTLTYKNVYPNTHIRYTQEGENRRMDIIISDASVFVNAPVDAEAFVFLQQIKLPSNWNALLVDGEIMIEDAQGEFVMKYPTPRAIDMKGNDFAGAYEIENTEEGFILKLALNLGWLSSNDRTYPVKVDPSFKMMKSEE